MAHSEHRLHFARLLRPNSFGAVIGQEVALHLLSNSVARDVLFPVYLLSGMRGSGKTTVGRLFAAAVNCDRMVEYRSSSCAWADLPCGMCKSCLLMRRGEHPDFVEVDAASYTGVEHIRQIMEEAQFLPVLGRKKIYLVDEAHMLSKSAFNAFLKMLEEPPESVLFLLATTEVHKIIETVRSRSFQLFFDPIPAEKLAAYIEKIAEQQNIICSSEAARLIAQYSEGSVRDALMALEQAWLHQSTITEASVRDLFGLVSCAAVFDIYLAIARQDISFLYTVVRSMLGRMQSIDHTWRLLVAIATAGMWYEAGVPLEEPFDGYKEMFDAVISLQAPQGFAKYLDVFFRYEPLLAKTHQPDCLFMRMLLTFFPANTATSGIVAIDGVKKKESGSPVQKHVPIDQKLKNEKPQVEKSEESSVENSGLSDSVWKTFVMRVQVVCPDPIINSVFASGCFVGCVDGVVQVSFPKSFLFYQELLLNARNRWQGVLEELFGAAATLVPVFVDRDVVVSSEKSAPSCAIPLCKQLDSDSTGNVHVETKPVRKRTVGVVDVSDVERWPLANTLMQVLPGNVYSSEE